MCEYMKNIYIHFLIYFSQIFTGRGRLFSLDIYFCKIFIFIKISYLKFYYKIKQAIFIFIPFRYILVGRLCSSQSNSCESFLKYVFHFWHNHFQKWENARIKWNWTKRGQSQHASPLEAYTEFSLCARTIRK